MTTTEITFGTCRLTLLRVARRWALVKTLGWCIWLVDRLAKPEIRQRGD